MVTRLLVRLLVHRSSVTGLPLVRLLVHRSCVCSSVCSSACSCIAGLPFVCRCSARVMGARPSDHPLLVRLFVHRSSVTDLSARPYLLVHWLCIARMPVPLPLVCLLVAAPSLVCRWSAVDLSRVHCSFVYSSFCWSAAFLSLVYRCSVCWGRGRCSVCCSAVGPPAPLSVRPSLVSHWSVAGPSLVCLFVSLCSVTYPSLSRLLGPWSLTCLLVSYLSLLCRWSVARLLHSAVPLLDSAAPLLHCSTRLALHSYSVG